jgi:uncharacterized membrane protein
MNYLIRITIEFVIYKIYLGITQLISFSLPNLKKILEEYKNNKTHKSCFIISCISSIVLSVAFVVLIKLKSGTFLDSPDVILIFVFFVALGYIGLLYSGRKFG